MRRVFYCLLAISIVASGLLAVPTLGAQVGSTITINARGAVGSEDLELELNGVVVETWNDIGTSTTDFTYDHAGGGEVERLRVRLHAGGSEPGFGDQNLRVDYVQIDAARFETEASTTRSTGTWSGSCNAGYKRSEWLHCSVASNGYFEYEAAVGVPLGESGGGPSTTVPPPTTVPTTTTPPTTAPTTTTVPLQGSGATINIRALGSVGNETMELEINGVVVATWNGVARTFDDYTYETPEPTVITSLRVRLVSGTSLGGDRNLRVDYIDIGDQRFQSENSANESRGTWTGNCNQGFKQSEWIHCSNRSNGWIQFHTVAGMMIGEIDVDPTADTDEDGVLDIGDNCVAVSNADQIDTDTDGFGDPCDASPFGPDADGDSFFAFGEVPDPDDGDECIPDNSRTTCDSDGDGVPNGIDECLLIAGVAANAGCPAAVTPGSGETLRIRALGSRGVEVMELELNGEVVESWSVSANYADYEFTPQSPVVVESLRLLLVDGTSRNSAGDRNLRVDYIEIADQIFQAEAATTESNGTWSGSCNQGFKRSEWIHCSLNSSGWLHFHAATGVSLGGEPEPNEAPVITSLGADGTAAPLQPENSAFAAVLAAEDTNLANRLTWSIVGGDDAGLFGLNAQTGRLRLARQDFEAPADANGDNVYEVVVAVTDSGTPALSDSLLVTITIVDLEPEEQTVGVGFIAPTAPTYIPVYDTAWQMFGQATPDEADDYFAGLNDFGFTGSWAAILHHAPARLNDNYRNGGSIGSIVDGEVRLSEGYIERVNAILDAADANDMKVGALVAWQNLYFPDGRADLNNPGSNQVRGIIDEANACAYGIHMVEEFGSHPAISMWVLGGDAGGNNGERQKDIWETMHGCMEPLTDLDFGHHLPTAFNVSNPNGDGHLLYTDADWLDMAAPETGHNQGPAQTFEQLRTAVEAYDIPVWQGEPRYHGLDLPWLGSFTNPGVDDVVADAQAAEDAGVAGYLFGSSTRWNWCTHGTSLPCSRDQMGATFGEAEAAVIDVFTE